MPHQPRTLVYREPFMTANHLSISADAFGDITEATVKKVTGNEDYKFGDLTKGAVKSLTGKDEYKFGDISKSFLKAWKRGDDEKVKDKEKDKDYD
jgi:hypothetical protein